MDPVDYEGMCGLELKKSDESAIARWIITKVAEL